MKKIVSAVIAVALVAAAVILLPGGLARLAGGNSVAPSPLVAAESTLTEAETTIPAADIDPTWSAATATYVTLAEGGMAVRGVGASLSEDGRVLTIRQKGTYVFSGAMADGQIVVDVAEGRVHLVLAGASLGCATSSPVFVRSASCVRLIAEAGTENYLSDSAAYTGQDALTKEPDATLFSADDLVLCGRGTLTIEGNYRDAIHAKDRLTLSDLTLHVRAREDGIVARDALLLRAVDLTATCGKDGIKANNPAEGLGYLYAESGRFSLTVGQDAFEAAGRMLLSGGTYQLLCGGGYAGTPGTVGCKGVKAATELVVTGGDFEIDALDDALHTDGRMAIAGGSFSLYSGDDALMANEMHIGGGRVTVRTCMDGLVAETMEITGGELTVTAQADGLRARTRRAQEEGGFDLYPETVAETPSCATLTIRGGTLAIRANGDAAHVRGSMRVEGGLTLLSGPPVKGGDPVDCDGGLTITGGTLVALGHTGYLPALTADSSAAMVEASFAAPQAADVPLTLRQEQEALVTVLPLRTYYKMVIFSTALREGAFCTLRSGGEVEGETRIFAGPGVLGGGTIGAFHRQGGAVSLTAGGTGYPGHYEAEDIL